MMEKAVKTLQRFYRNYMCFERDEEGHLIDPIMLEPFDKEYSVKIFFPTGLLVPGGRDKVHIFNISTLWQNIVVNHSINSPITEGEFSPEQLEIIIKCAVKTETVTQSQAVRIMRPFMYYLGSQRWRRLFEQVPRQLVRQNIKHLNYQAIVAAATGNCKLVNQIVSEHGDDINNDLFFINKLIPLSVVGEMAVSDTENIKLCTILPDCLRSINLTMAAAMGCNKETFIMISNMDANYLLEDSDSKLTCMHLAAYGKNIEVCQIIATLIPDLAFHESDLGSPYQILADRINITNEQAMQLILL